METSLDIEKQKVLTVKQVITIVIFAVVTTFSLSMIYAEFKVMGEEAEALKIRIEYVNDRLTRNIDKFNP